MKDNKIILFVLLVFQIMSCKSVNTKILPLEKNFNQFFESSNDLQIYFPLFTDEEGKNIAGDGIVIIFPDKEVMIIDGFYSEASQPFISFLKNDLQISKIDYLVASHFHGDHIGTFPAIIDNFKVKNFYSNGAVIDRETSLLLTEKLKETGLQEIVLTEGDKIQIGKVLIEVLYPSLTDEDLYTIFYNPGKNEKKINLSSLVMKLVYDDFSILFTGDIYIKAENLLVKEYGSKLKSTVLKAPHHADPYTSNTRSFLKAVNPELVIAQRPDEFLFFTKIRFRSMRIPLIRVEEKGYLKLVTDGNLFEVFEIKE
ncbi:MAG: MBL fold metallo-hydrolase [Spirochaetaceae bacterium]|nr:MBL fold metallo-hydrolase [Spirochaetaceae bacterium]